jgi:hypothetical protein
MAGSPAYIDLLARIGSLPPSPFNTWADVDAAWSRVEETPDRITLFHLANTSFALLSATTGIRTEQLMAEATELHVAKNAGYAGAENPDPWANFRLSQRFDISPFRGVLVRLTDKYSRIHSLRRNPANDRIGESILDTLRDLAAYALIAICLLDEERAAA